ncbi:DUF4241 domain-containing protein [Foetidibacter luteolus]|uniref:DUF4241 domain-containing protein n=1 Tax=Foetidibacter luteolus TaxID=2608880 RepID=UPI00129BB296|nr:DUF4241 domain-containing protein [Foetidibacter luteolus]
MQDFLENAFQNNFSHLEEEKNEYKFYRVDIGKLNVANGQIIACDPFLFNDDKPFDTVFPIGHFPIELAIACIDDDERIGFSRIKFSDKSPVRWTIAVTVDQDATKLSDDEIFGYGVDSGTGCFMDTSGAEKYSDYLNQKEDNFNVVIDEMEATYKHTRSWLIWDRDGFNVAMYSTGWGDGLYATYIGYDSENSICRLVSDFGLLEWQQ